jgi:glycosyltransferase involved in cell wall biosynthesis
VRERIRRFYGRDSVVIPAPVDLADLRPAPASADGPFLWVNRLVPYKRPEVVMEAFRGLPYRLTMVGIGPLEASLRARLPHNVELLGWVPRERLAELYASARGLIHVGEEDFGIVMVEALGSGTPVIALRAGGALDIVRDGVDGILVDQADPASIEDAVRRLASASWDPGSLAERARDFAPERFASRMRDALSELMSEPAA